MPRRKPWRKPPAFPDRSDRFDDSSSGYLGDVESSLTGFGETGTRGFSDAWQDAEGTVDTAASAFANDEADTKGRDLNTGSRRWMFLAAALVCLGIGGWFAYNNGVFETELPASPVAGAAPALVAPNTPRIYVTEPLAISREVSVEGESLFIHSDIDSDPQPAAAGVPSLVRGLRAGPVLWSGRTHLALTGMGIDNPERCVVATLVTQELGTIDLAAFGNCDEEYLGTGDRVACAGGQLLLLELWPYDPRSVTPPAAVAGIRYRVEEQREDGSVLSQRGVVPISTTNTGDSLVAESTVLGGAPGTVVTVDGADCELLDRSDVAILLLPS